MRSIFFGGETVSVRSIDAFAAIVAVSASGMLNEENLNVASLEILTFGDLGALLILTFVSPNTPGVIVVGKFQTVTIFN